jgi:hypothetical protein
MSRVEYQRLDYWSSSTFSNAQAKALPGKTLTYVQSADKHRAIASVKTWQALYGHRAFALSVWAFRDVGGRRRRPRSSYRSGIATVRIRL